MVEEKGTTFDSTKNAVEQPQPSFLEKIRSKVDPFPLRSYTQSLAKKFKSAIPETKKDLKETFTGNKEQPGIIDDFGNAIGVTDMTRWGYHKGGSHGLPTMGTIAYGSKNLPYDMRNQRPFFGRVGGGSFPATSTPKKPKRQIISETDYQGLLTAGYSEADLRSYGIESKQSRQYQTFSVFGRSVAPYRPLSYGQCFCHQTPRQQEYQKEIANPVYEIYSPEFLGKDQALFKPPTLFLRW